MWSLDHHVVGALREFVACHTARAIFVAVADSRTGELGGGATLVSIGATWVVHRALTGLVLGTLRVGVTLSVVVSKRGQAEARDALTAIGARITEVFGANRRLADQVHIVRDGVWADGADISVGAVRVVGTDVHTEAELGHSAHGGVAEGGAALARGAVGVIVTNHGAIRSLKTDVLTALRIGGTWVAKLARGCVVWQLAEGFVSVGGVEPDIAANPDAICT